MLSELHGLSERWFQAWLEKDAATVEAAGGRGLHLHCPERVEPSIVRPSWRSSVLRAIGWIMARAPKSLSAPWAMTRPWCGTTIRVPARSRALPSRMTSGVSWSGRNTPASGDS